MDITLHTIPIRELYKDYINNDEAGILAYSGKLNVRPAYQREFVYNDKQRDAVIKSLRSNLPLNIMYWSVNTDGTYELLDGQQRTISVLSYIHGDFSIDFQFFFNLTKEEQEQILNYELMIYFCKGTDKEKLEWFRTINIAGEKLTEQELRNAVYSGPFITNLKKYFSKTQCPAQKIGDKYINGSSIRQDYLEKVLMWISDGEIDNYMAQHQFQEQVGPVWAYFQSVINWIEVTFPVYRREMKGLEWGELFNEYRNKIIDPLVTEERIKKLMEDEDVTKKKGIYEYILTNNEKCLSIRAFTAKQKREAYEKQNGVCPICGEHFEIDDMEADHITPWVMGGTTTADNCQMLCRHCNRTKSNK